MRASQICSYGILIVLSIYLLISLLTNYNEDKHILPGPIPGSLRIPKTKHGIIYDLTSAYASSDNKLNTSDDDNFIVTGFKFYKNLPILVKKITRNFRPRNSWLLHGKNAIGNITLLNVQREQPRMEAVLVVVNYYTSWNWAVEAVVTVTGLSFNRDTNEIEEESEMLTDNTGGEPTRNDYCQKIVYFGAVEEVIVGGRIQDTDDALVLIENVKVVVGRSEFDNAAELTCT